MRATIPEVRRHYRKLSAEETGEVVEALAEVFVRFLDQRAIQESETVSEPKAQPAPGDESQ